jgi:hypothetical protein
MNVSRRGLLQGAGAAGVGLLLGSPRAHAMTTISSLPSADFESGKFCLAQNITYGRDTFFPTPLPASAIRLSDYGVLDGNHFAIFCSDGAASESAIIKLYKTHGFRGSDRTMIENLRFGFARYGIMTPFEADRPAASENPPPAHEWYNRGGHVIRKVHGHAYDQAIRIAGYNTLLERFNIEAGGTTAEPNNRVIAVELLGPNPIVRDGAVRKINYAPPTNGGEVEAVGLALSADCDGGLVENVSISNPIRLANTIGLWCGYSDGIVVRNMMITNMEFAALCADASVVFENCRSVNCQYGFSYLLPVSSVKMRNCYDWNFVDGEWGVANASNA